MARPGEASVGESGPMRARAPARVFISYAQESDELANDVLALANQMRQQDGIDAWIDRYGQQVPRAGARG